MKIMGLLLHFLILCLMQLFILKDWRILYSWILQIQIVSMGISQTSQKVFPVHFNLPCKFITHEHNDNLIISAVARHPPSSNKVYLKQDKYKTIIIKKDTEFSYRFDELKGVNFLGILNGFGDSDEVLNQQVFVTNTLQNIQQPILEQYTSKNQVKRIMQLQNCDYVTPIEGNTFVQGLYNTQICAISKLNSVQEQRQSLYTNKLLNMGQKYIQNAQRLNNHTLTVAYTKFGLNAQDNMTADGISCIDLVTGMNQLIYQQPYGEVLFQNFLTINNNCLAVGSEDLDFQYDLKMLDTRVGGIVSVIDTSRNDFAGTSWLCHYNMLYKISDYEIATFWGGPATKVGDVVLFDLRFPLRRQTLHLSVQHFRHFHRFKRNGRYEDFIIRNIYQKYSYQYSLVQKIMR